jgi:hypothetical protein
LNSNGCIPIKMWLINTDTLKLEQFYDKNVPPYVILSHTWGQNELTFQDIQDLTPDVREKNGYRKVTEFCELAKRYDYEYAWVDTCSIDKSSSSELTEAINSMYKWYHNADMCIVYLEDYPPPSVVMPPLVEAKKFSKSHDLSGCRWLYRGWTLQELIAPEDVRFFDSSWNLLGSKSTMLDVISEMTRINKLVLNGVMKVSECTVAERFSWASHRETTRDEDIAYCLFGLFDVHMPLVYGEGKQRAFRRLQIEITKETCDFSLFLWSSPTISKDVTSQIFLDSGVFADDPSYFSYSDLSHGIDYRHLRYEPPSMHPAHIIGGPKHDPFDPPIQNEAGLKANLYTIKEGKGSILVCVNCIDERRDQLVFIRLNRAGPSKLPFAQYCRRLPLHNLVVLKDRRSLLDMGSTTSHVKDPFSEQSYAIQIHQVRMKIPMPVAEVARKRTVPHRRRTTLTIYSSTVPSTTYATPFEQPGGPLSKAKVKEWTHHSTATEQEMLDKIGLKSSEAMQFATIKCYVSPKDPLNIDRFHFYVILAKCPSGRPIGQVEDSPPGRGPLVCCWAICSSDLTAEECLDLSRSYTWNLNDIETILGPAAERFHLQTKGMGAIDGSIWASHPQKRYSTLESQIGYVEDQAIIDIQLILDVNSSMTIVDCDCTTTWKDVLGDIDSLSAVIARPPSLVHYPIPDAGESSSVEASQSQPNSIGLEERDSGVDMSSQDTRHSRKRSSLRVLVRSFTDGGLKEMLSPKNRQSFL